MLDNAVFMRDSSEMSGDPLSEVVELVRARCGISGRLIAGGAWSRRFANLNSIKLCAAISGGAWCFMESMNEPARFVAGDVLITNGTQSLILASDRSLISSAVASPLFQDESGVYRLGQGEDFAMVGGAVQIDERRQPLLLDGLPPMLHVNRNHPEATPLGWLLDQIVREMEPGVRPGRGVILAELAQLLFVNSLRAYLALAPENDRGWLRGLGDARLASALARMHAEPSRDWSLDDLAQTAAMSRTSFAVRFRNVMGMPPLTYLTNWRMHIAERDLCAGASVAQVAEMAGYTSESAFSHAFKRTMGLAPGLCRREGDTGETMLEPHRAMPTF